MMLPAGEAAHPSILDGDLGDPRGVFELRTFRPPIRESRSAEREAGSALRTDVGRGLPEPTRS